MIKTFVGPSFSQFTKFTIYILGNHRQFWIIVFMLYKSFKENNDLVQSSEICVPLAQIGLIVHLFFQTTIKKTGSRGQHSLISWRILFRWGQATDKKNTSGKLRWRCQTLFNYVVLRRVNTTVSTNRSMVKSMKALGFTNRINSVQTCVVLDPFIQ